MKLMLLHLVHLRRLALVGCVLAVIGAAALGGCGRSSAVPAGVRVWHWMTDREDAFNELAKRYHQETGTAVRFELYAPSDVYIQKVRAAAQTNGLPDIYGILGESRDLASFIHAGHVLPLDAAMHADGGAWQSVFFPKALAVNAFSPGNAHSVDPGVYGVPLDVMNIQLFYNKKLLAKLGGDPERPPATWGEFLAVGKRAHAEHLIGFVSGWAELWLLECFATDYAVHLMDVPKIEATYRGDIPYTSPEWIKVFQLFADLRESGMLADGIVTMVNKQAEQFFANERAVFAFNGTWGVNVYQSMNPALDYGVAMLPRLHTSRPMVTWGGAGSSFFVNARSTKQVEALKFLTWLTAAPQQAYLLETTHNIPANRDAAAQLPPALAAFADDMDQTIHPRLLSVQERSAVIEAFSKGIQSILIGEATPQQVAQQVQEVKRREQTRQAALDQAHAVR